MPSHNQISSILWLLSIQTCASGDCGLYAANHRHSCVTANLHQLIELHLAVPHIFSKVHSLRLEKPNIVICMECDPLNQNSSKCLKQIFAPLRGTVNLPDLRKLTLALYPQEIPDNVDKMIENIIASKQS